MIEKWKMCFLGFLTFSTLAAIIVCGLYLAASIIMDIKAMRSDKRRKVGLNRYRVKAWRVPHHKVEWYSQDSGYNCQWCPVYQVSDNHRRTVIETKGKLPPR